VIFVLVTGAIALLLGATVFAVPFLFLLAIPFAVQFAVFLSLRLELDDQGISLGVSWLPPGLRVSGSWREFTWASTPGELQITGSRTRIRRGIINLKTFDSDWRMGPIGADISRWAPDLIAQLGDVSPNVRPPGSV
jgi:hypothetical protein